jgi:hypothetical protein
MKNSPGSPRQTDLVELAIDASLDAVVNAKCAKADLEDTGETRASHAAAAVAHGKAAEALRQLASLCHEAHRFELRMLFDSSAARHSAAAAAHQFAQALANASADDPCEDGSGMELSGQATMAAMTASLRANSATAAVQAATSN